jgi:hypothetical protein
MDTLALPQPPRQDGSMADWTPESFVNMLALDVASTDERAAYVAFVTQQRAHVPGFFDALYRLIFSDVDAVVTRHLDEVTATKLELEVQLGTLPSHCVDLRAEQRCHTYEQQLYDAQKESTEWQTKAGKYKRELDETGAFWRKVSYATEASLDSLRTEYRTVKTLVDQLQVEADALRLQVKQVDGDRSQSVHVLLKKDAEVNQLKGALFLSSLILLIIL